MAVHVRWPSLERRSVVLLRMSILGLLLGVLICLTSCTMTHPVALANCTDEPVSVSIIFYEGDSRFEEKYGPYEVEAGSVLVIGQGVVHSSGDVPWKFSWGDEPGQSVSYTYWELTDRGGVVMICPGCGTAENP